MTIDEAIEYINSRVPNVELEKRYFRYEDAYYGVLKGGAKYDLSALQRWAENVSDNTGNYAFYIKKGRLLVIDGKGASNRYIPVDRSIFWKAVHLS